MIITDDMLVAAFRYRDTNLWNILTDSDVFAFRLSDGEIGYCCVMGNAGEHLSLGFYRGKKGFATYLKSITMNQLSDLEILETVMTFDCINCDFMAATDLNDKTKKTIREYADRNNLKIRRPNGWPDFTRHQPYKMQYGITREDDARDITEALHAAIEVAEKLTGYSFVNLGFDKKDNYPTIKGGKSVPYLVPNADATYEWTTITLPALMKTEYTALKFDNDILSHKVKALPKSDVLQLRLIHVPAPTGSESEVPFFPALMLCVNPSTGYLFPIPCMEDFEENPMQVLAAFADTLCNNNSKPQMIQVEDTKTELILKDFCHRCGIVLSHEHTLPQLNEALGALINNFM